MQTPDGAKHTDVAVHPFQGARGLLLEIGETPLLDLTALVVGEIPPAVRLLGKAEWFNPGGSIKDRSALSMVLDAERSGRLGAGGVILDASSGNTAVSYAMIAAARGYRATLCLPKNANRERQRLLRAYGATVELTSPVLGTDGAIRRARELASDHPDWVYLDQFGNDANWRAHYATTGPEIWRDTHGAVTHLVAGLGTSGTMMGTARYLKERKPSLRAVAVQPDGPFHGLEGVKHLGTALVPPLYDERVVDRQIDVPTETAYARARRMGSTRGLLLGPSAAACLWAGVRVARDLREGTVVCVLADGGVGYQSEAHIWRPPLSSP